MPADVLQEPQNCADTRGPANQAVMQPDRHELGGSRAFLVQHLERVAQIDEELFGRGETGVLVEAVVVGFVGIRNDQMSAATDIEPVGELVGERVTVVQKATLLDQEPPRIGPRASSHPAQGPRTRELRDARDRARDMLAFGCLGDLGIIDPAPTVADDLMPVGQKRRHDLGILLERAHNGEHADLDVETAE